MMLSRRGWLRAIGLAAPAVILNPFSLMPVRAVDPALLSPDRVELLTASGRRLLWAPLSVCSERILAPGMTHQGKTAQPKHAGWREIIYDHVTFMNVDEREPITQLVSYWNGGQRNDLSAGTAGLPLMPNGGNITINDLSGWFKPKT